MYANTILTVLLASHLGSAALFRHGESAKSVSYAGFESQVIAARAAATHPSKADGYIAKKEEHHSSKDSKDGKKHTSNHSKYGKHHPSKYSNGTHHHTDKHDKKHSKGYGKHSHHFHTITVHSTASTSKSSIQISTTTTAPTAGKNSGDITYYAPGLGSCGVTNGPSDMIVALAADMMTGYANPNDNPNCGKSITISYNGVTATATIEDTCEACTGASIDLTPSLFEKFAPLGVGRVSGVEWWFN